VKLTGEAGDWTGVCYSVKDGVTFVVAFGLAALARTLDRRRIHCLALLLGAVGLLGVGLCRGYENRTLLLVAIGVGGIAWASILSMPYSMLASCLPPERMGVYMGIFNFFIVLPEILSALALGYIIKHLLGGDVVLATQAGGACLAVAAILALTVPSERDDVTA
jgi:maltose/moltooligosaccharide transporter